MKNLRASALVAASAVALGLMSITQAFAADPIGTWLTGDKKGKVKIVNCGGAICGTLSWLAEPNEVRAVLDTGAQGKRVETKVNDRIHVTTRENESGVSIETRDQEHKGALIHRSSIAR